MPRCQYPKCDRIVRDPNKYGLCHVHMEMGDFFMWFSEFLQRTEKLGGTGTERRPSGLLVPPTAGR